MAGSWVRAVLGAMRSGLRALSMTPWHETDNLTASIKVYTYICFLTNMYIHTHIYVYTYVRVCIYISIFMYLFIYLFIDLYVYTCLRRQGYTTQKATS